ncbi:hypothetical protein FPL14_06775 [Cohnella cholangitidis]|uniref:Uncharacterized protein n=2 Tax=Cohnella cholangitidis TaxID=2598458 RepID=A0A7G5C6T1_9BACL|nr:hypothetical protein FPL14_06775 [Cohnella cholangitidis]
MYHLCKSHMNRRVRIHTRCGCYEGVIVNVDQENVYLRTSDGLRLSGKAKTSAWLGYGGYGGYGYGAGFDILALSLFTLLAIALI